MSPSTPPSQAAAVPSQLQGIGRNPKRMVYFVELPHQGVQQLAEVETCILYDTDTHSHAQLQSLWTLEGRFTLHMGKEVVHMEPGSVAVLPAGFLHRIEKDSDSANIRLLDLRLDEGLARYVEHVTAGFVIRLPLPDLMSRADRLRRLASNPKTNPADLLAEIWHLLALLGKQGGVSLHNMPSGMPSEPSDADGKDIGPRIAAVEAVMRAHLDRALGVADFAALSHCSAGHLNRLFQEQRGQTPAARFRELRLERAEKLLTNSCQSIAEVAGACGFNGTSQFVRAFRNTRGVSPGAFRKRGGRG